MRALSAGARDTARDRSFCFPRTTAPHSAHDALSLPPQLRGGKFSNWEGGIRVNAFISGGFIPPAARGTVQSGLTAGWDWYATLAGLAGADPTDHRAAAAGLPPIDSIGASRRMLDSPLPIASCLTAE